MLVNDNAETIPATKIDTMFINSNQEKLDIVASPRVLNTHFPPSWLPMKELKGTANASVSDNCQI